MYPLAPMSRGVRIVSPQIVDSVWHMWSTAFKALGSFLVRVTTGATIWYGYWEIIAARGWRHLGSTYIFELNHPVRGLVGLIKGLSATCWSFELRRFPCRFSFRKDFALPVTTLRFPHVSLRCLQRCLQRSEEESVPPSALIIWRRRWSARPASTQFNQKFATFHSP